MIIDSDSCNEINVTDSQSDGDGNSDGEHPVSMKNTMV